MKDAKYNDNKILLRSRGLFPSDKDKEISQTKKRTQRCTECFRNPKIWDCWRIKEKELISFQYAKELNISKSGYYDYLKREPNQAKRKRERLTRKIKEPHEESYVIYGSPKTTEILNKSGENVS